MGFIGGLIIGAVVLTLVFWIRNQDISLTWYEWLIGVLGLGLLLFTVQNFFGSLSEFESMAAWLFLPVTGLPSLILLGLAWFLAQRRQSAG